MITGEDFWQMKLIQMVTSKKKKPFYFSLLTQKPKFIVLLLVLQYQFLSSCLEQTTRGAVSAKSSTWISCSVILFFAFRHERWKSLTSWDWKQTPASGVLQVCTITTVERRDKINTQNGILWPLKKVSANLSLEIFDFGGKKSFFKRA